ncbi:MAG: hypothetical protein OQK51_25775 [Kangiellaceae bacterium]|nr:hypothetical protein [Kangiellaceae bacterium]
MPEVGFDSFASKIRMDIIKLTLVLLLSIVLVGCPTAFNANIGNDSEGLIVIVPSFKTDYRVKIEKNETEREKWYQECITVIDGNKKYYFKGWPVPSNVIQTHIFSSSLNVRFKQGQLYYENNEGKLYPVKKLTKCS